MKVWGRSKETDWVEIVEARVEERKPERRWMEKEDRLKDVPPPTSVLVISSFTALCLQHLTSPAQSAPAGDDFRVEKRKEQPRKEIKSFVDMSKSVTRLKP